MSPTTRAAGSEPFPSLRETLVRGRMASEVRACGGVGGAVTASRSRIEDAPAPVSPASAPPPSPAAPAPAVRALVVTRTGRAIVYTGFQWRGRSSETGKDDSALREVMFVDRDWRTIEGRWFTGGYDELGLDVRLERVGAEPRVLGTDRTALRAGSDGAGVEDLRRQSAGRRLQADADRSRSWHHGDARVVGRHGEVATVTVDVAANAAPWRARSVRRRRVAAEGARRLRQHRRASK